MVVAGAILVFLFFYWFIGLVLAIQKHNRIQQQILNEKKMTNFHLDWIEKRLDRISKNSIVFNNVSPNPLESHAFKFAWIRIKKFFANIEETLEDIKNK